MRGGENTIMDLGQAKNLKRGQLYSICPSGAYTYLYKNVESTENHGTITEGTIVLFLSYVQDDEGVIHCEVLVNEVVGWLASGTLSLAGTKPWT